MRRVARAIAAAVLFLSFGAPGQTFATDDVVEEAGRTFPTTVGFHYQGTNYALNLTGTSVRKKFVFKGYAIAHYMEAGDYATVDEALFAALSGKYAMQITMDFVRDIETEKIQKAYREGFQKHATEAEWAEIEPLVESFIGHFERPVKKYDQYILRSLPGGTILATIQGIEGDPIENPTFASVLWRIWLAKGSVVNRKDLVRMAVVEEDKD